MVVMEAATVEAEEASSARCLAACSGRPQACGCMTAFSTEVRPAGAAPRRPVRRLAARITGRGKIPITPALVETSEAMTAEAEISVAMTAEAATLAEAAILVGVGISVAAVTSVRVAISGVGILAAVAAISKSTSLSR